ncbi:hypothetical protein HMPREF2531_03780 [Bacteroides intestinalis]|uniref:Uncharacterized protein n=2 Tax=Bacteroides TaxID=816 RepID=A0A139L0H9_9BACE|nr:hypothetical protein BACCELL_05434 [Bacteroides cellulosilyticus DSM 14838]KXT44947.1 hypothetical protein HMPREF2531_03780 [Bacteroides intestinalis]
MFIDAKLQRSFLFKKQNLIYSCFVFTTGVYALIHATVCITSSSSSVSST